MINIIEIEENMDNEEVKPIEEEKDEYWGMWFTCPKCREPWITRIMNYCPMCGVKLDW